MKIHLTKHSLQRRDHYDKEDPEVIKLVFTELLKDKELEDGKYKMHFRYFCCIFKKNKELYTVITIRGHRKLLEKNHLDKPKIRLANSAFYSTGGTGGFIIRRKNFLGNIVKCGYIIDIAGTYMRLLKLNNGVLKKYDLSGIKYIPKIGLKFKDDSEISEIVTFNQKEQCWYLNDFNRL